MSLTASDGGLLCGQPLAKDARRFCRWFIPSPSPYVITAQRTPLLNRHAAAPCSRAANARHLCCLWGQLEVTPMDDFARLRACGGPHPSQAWKFRLPC